MNEQQFDAQNETSEMQDNLSQDTTDNMTENTQPEEGAGEISTIDAAELEKLREERDEAKDKYIRLVAEFDNFRRRNAKERIELTQTAGKEIIQSLLEVLDDMNRAEKQLDKSEDLQQIKEGIMLVFNKFKNTMLQKGLKAMDCVNQDFDPELHEAITEIPVPTEDAKGKIIDVIEPGYYLNEKLIRYAKVIVGK